MLKNSVLASAFVATLSLFAGSALAENVQHAGPKFSCSVTPNAKSGELMVIIKKTGGGATAADKDVVAIVNLPKEKKDAAVCGKALEKDGSEAKVSVAAKVEEKFPYTCEAAEGKTTFACNPVR
jgi:hypothetical protein